MTVIKVLSAIYLALQYCRCACSPPVR